MKQEISTLTALLNERLLALKSLAQEISQGQEACIALNREKLQEHDLQKQALCARVSRLDSEIAALLQEFSPGASLRSFAKSAQAGAGPAESAAMARLQELLKDSEAARLEAGRLNHVYGELLRRSRSTLQVLMNVLAHCLGVYPSSTRTGSPAASFERSY